MCNLKNDPLGDENLPSFLCQWGLISHMRFIDLCLTVMGMLYHGNLEIYSAKVNSIDFSRFGLEPSRPKSMVLS